MHDSTGRDQAGERIHRRWLPQGTPLPEDVWLLRHRVFLVAAWAASAVALVWATAARGPLHGVLDFLPLAVAALVATLVRPGARRWGREAAACAVMLSLTMAAAVAVHLSGGLIEMHFLFFVAVGAATAYQTWAPLLTAVGFVVVHHGLMGTVAGHAIFNHPAAQERPGLWALLHGLLLAVAAAVGIASWRADEVVRARLAAVAARSSLIMDTVEDGIVALDETGSVVEANPAAVALLGRDGPVLGRRLCDLVPGVCDDDQIEALLRGERPAVPRQVSVLDPRGSGGGAGVPVGVTVAPVRGDEAVRAVVTLRDLSSAARAVTAERALVDLTERERVQREDVAALMAAVRPPTLAVEGLELAVAYEPAASAPAGGDLYDWLVLPSGEALLIVVDAMGRGTAATREALAVTSTVRTLAVAGCPLQELVARSAAVLDVTHPDLMATLLIAVVDPATGRLRLAGGGHPPAIHVTSTGAREVTAEGLGIGYPDPGSFGTAEVVLAPGDTLVLYTDGLIEGTRDVPAGLRELAGTAAGMTAVPVEQFAPRLLTDVTTCALEEDDCLAVVIRRPAAATAPQEIAPQETAPQEAGPAAASGPGAPRFVRDVAADLAQVPPARAAAATWLAERDVDPEVVDTCALLASELLANAVRHARTPAQLRLQQAPREILLEVSDGLGVEPLVRAADEEATGGRGMHLVAALSQRWGTHSAAEGKTVWCAVPLQEPPAGQAPRVPARVA
ncbi:PAS domain-containing protein [Kineococcus xinjiangensis]|uniref:PAS domain-containing protein n=1 Tax=Kineococcus xinjiangensis TaxID=512762 RepID=A0A2S6IF71_9ACTN|nr:ATP-binding SpoIIE family protein phosphatase [Kineococcus xinjiangensis]PPK92858.1 PAS domain-containing protein [Kineococcus xinjiangensis]